MLQDNVFKHITQINWKLVISFLLLCIIGLVNLYSASGVRTEDGLFVSLFFHKQLVWELLSLGIMLVIIMVDYRHFYAMATGIFIASIILLIAVPLIGKTVYGAKRWISLGFFSIQPSEIAKIAMLLMGAKLLSRRKESLDWGELIIIFSIASIPALLVLSQPDLGTTICMLAILGGIVLFRGLKVAVVRILLILVPVFLPLSWFLLRDYQKRRILTMLSPERDPLGAGYHVIQSQIAIGSGGMLGSGYLSGSQSQLRFLPEKHTDFALAVFGEEWGFLGLIFLLIVYVVFLIGIFEVIRDAKDRFGSYLCVGIFFYFFSQIFVNMGMVMGIMPVVGIPLPFISYGGTSTVVNFIFIGILINVSLRRFVFKTT